MVFAPVRTSLERKTLARSNTSYINAIEFNARRTTGPTAAQHRDLMSFPCKLSENFVQMNFCTTGLRVFAILPVHNGNAKRGVEPRSQPAEPARVLIEYAIYKARTAFRAETFGQTN